MHDTEHTAPVHSVNHTLVFSSSFGLHFFLFWFSGFSFVLHFHPLIETAVRCVSFARKRGLFQNRMIHDAVLTAFTTLTIT